MPEAQGDGGLASTATANCYAIHMGALPEEHWGNTEADNGRLLSLARA